MEEVKSEENEGNASPLASSVFSHEGKKLLKEGESLQHKTLRTSKTTIFVHKPSSPLSSLRDADSKGSSSEGGEKVTISKSRSLSSHLGGERRSSSSGNYEKASTDKISMAASKALLSVEEGGGRNSGSSKRSDSEHSSDYGNLNGGRENLVDGEEVGLWGANSPSSFGELSKTSTSRRLMKLYSGVSRGVSSVGDISENLKKVESSATEASQTPQTPKNLQTLQTLKTLPSPQLPQPTPTSPNPPKEIASHRPNSGVFSAFASLSGRTSSFSDETSSEDEDLTPSFVSSSSSSSEDEENAKGRAILKESSAYDSFQHSYLVKMLAADTAHTSLKTGAVIHHIGPRSIAVATVCANEPKDLAVCEGEYHTRELPERYGKSINLGEEGVRWGGDGEDELGGGLIFDTHNLERCLSTQRVLYAPSEKNYPYGNGGLTTPATHTVYLKEMPCVLFSTCLSTWNELVVHQESQTIVLRGSDSSSEAIGPKPALAIHLLHGLLKLSLSNTQLVSKLLKLFSSAQEVFHQFGGIMEGSACHQPLSFALSSNWELQFSSSGSLQFIRLKSYLLDNHALELTDLSRKGNHHQKKMRKRNYSIIEIVSRSLQADDSFGILSKLSEKEIRTSFDRLSYTDDDEMKRERECFEGFLRALRLHLFDDTQIKEILRSLMIVKVLQSLSSNRNAKETRRTLLTHTLSLLLKMKEISITQHIDKLKLLLQHTDVYAFLGSIIYKQIFESIFKRFCNYWNKKLTESITAAHQNGQLLSIHLLEFPNISKELATHKEGVPFECLTSLALQDAYIFSGVLKLRQLLLRESVLQPCRCLKKISEPSPIAFLYRCLLHPLEGLVASLMKGKQEISTLKAYIKETSKRLLEDESFLSYFEETNEECCSIRLQKHNGVLFKFLEETLCFELSGLVRASTEPNREAEKVIRKFMQAEGVNSLFPSEFHNFRGNSTILSQIQAFWEDMEDMMKHSVERTPYVVTQDYVDEKLKWGINATEEWQMKGYPVIIRLSDLHTYCKELFHPSELRNHGDVQQALLKYIPAETFLCGENLLFIKSEGYRMLSQIEVSESEEESEESTESSIPPTKVVQPALSASRGVWKGLVYWPKKTLENEEAQANQLEGASFHPSPSKPPIEASIAMVGETPHSPADDRRCVRNEQNCRFNFYAPTAACAKDDAKSSEKYCAFWTLIRSPAKKEMKDPHTNLPSTNATNSFAAMAVSEAVCCESSLPPNPTFTGGRSFRSLQNITSEEVEKLKKEDEQLTFKPVISGPLPHFYHF